MKKLRPNPVAQRELRRFGRYRVQRQSVAAARDQTLRVVVPLRNDKVTARSCGVETWREGLSVAELTERIMALRGIVWVET